MTISKSATTSRCLKASSTSCGFRRMVSPGWVRESFVFLVKREPASSIMFSTTTTQRPGAEHGRIRVFPSDPSRRRRSHRSTFNFRILRASEQAAEAVERQVRGARQSVPDAGRQGRRREVPHRLVHPRACAARGAGRPGADRPQPRPTRPRCRADRGRRARSHRLRPLLHRPAGPPDPGSMPCTPPPARATTAADCRSSPTMCCTPCCAAAPTQEAADVSPGRRIGTRRLRRPVHRLLIEQQHHRSSGPNVVYCAKTTGTPI